MILLSQVDSKITDDEIESKAAIAINSDDHFLDINTNRPVDSKEKQNSDGWTYADFGCYRKNCTLIPRESFGCNEKEDEKKVNKWLDELCLCYENCSKKAYDESKSCCGRKNHLCLYQDPNPGFPKVKNDCKNLFHIFMYRQKW